MNTPTTGSKQLLDLEVISLNVRGIRDDATRRKFFQYLKKQVSSKGIIFLQETHSTKHIEVSGLMTGMNKDTKNIHIMIM